jgi:hypothetical protein
MVEVLGVKLSAYKAGFKIIFSSMIMQSVFPFLAKSKIRTGRGQGRFLKTLFSKSPFRLSESAGADNPPRNES